MIRKVKALTLALVAVCAIGAVVASGASAKEFHIAGMGVVTGDGTQIAGSPTEFTIPEGALKCPGAIFNVHTFYNVVGGKEVDQETAADTVTVKVEEGGTETLACTFAGLSGSIVHMNGCDFRLHAAASQATVICPAGQQITITAIVTGVTKCTIHIPEQGDLPVQFTNNGPHIDVTSAINQIKYQSTSGTGLGACTATTAGTDGQFKGKITVTGTVNKVSSTISIA